MGTSDQDFAAFYDATWGRTVACAYAVTGELGAAEEAAQEAYARAWPRWSKLATYDDPGAWVRQVATRQAISGWRRKRTATAFLSRSRPPESAPPPDENTVALVAALRQLPEPQRRALVLHHLAGFSVADIAAAERCPEGTVKARLSRGRAALVPFSTARRTESPAMPEPDTFDLDAAFRGLAQHVADTTTPRGAGAAVATARRRRRTRIGAVAAAAVVIVSGAAIAQGVGGRDNAGPADLPSPAAFDAASFDAATAGWTSGWLVPTHNSQLPHHMRTILSTACMKRVNSSGKGTPNAEHEGGPLWVTPSGEVASTAFAEWGPDHPTAATTVYSELESSIDQCAEAKPSGSYAWGGEAVARSWTVPGAESGHIWIAREGDAMALVYVAGTAPVVPADVDRRVAAALVAGLQSPATYSDGGLTTSGSSSGSASESAGVPPSISADDFGRAVAGWRTAWSATSGDNSIDSVPCTTTAQWPGTNGGLVTTTLGGNGDQEYGSFDSVPAAKAALARLKQALSACAGSSYAVSEPVDGGGMLSIAAAGPDVVWAVQLGEQVGVVTVPGNVAAPPAVVSGAVVADIATALKESLTDPGSQVSSGSGVVTSTGPAATRTH